MVHEELTRFGIDLCHFGISAQGTEEVGMSESSSTNFLEGWKKNKEYLKSLH